MVVRPRTKARFLYLYLAVLSAVAGFAIVGELEVPSSTGRDLSTVVGTHVVPLDDANTYFSNFLKSSSTMLARLGRIKRGNASWSH